MSDETPDCPLCGTIMVWHDLVVQDKPLAPEGDSHRNFAQIRYCMNDKCLLGSDKRHEHMRLWN